ncbi:uncharacterized protein LOC135101610 isoform X2 [Scylla paramamosain]|uniref:uncharacterized protein LOC135101610 isoform X2 n=1 Tax=Scylla paramamosain TaxID=85552 RepID=UPI003082B4B3
MQMCTPRSNHCHPYRRRKVIRLWKSVVAGAVTLIFVLCVVVPLVFHYSPGLQRFFLFLNTVTTPISLNRPEDVGLPGTRNFYLKTDKDVTIGIWHILPRSLIHSVPDDVREWPVWYESSLKQQQPIILYLHGNKGSRAESHRVELYNKLRKMDYHVITLDYRGCHDRGLILPAVKTVESLASAALKELSLTGSLSPMVVKWRLPSSMMQDLSHPCYWRPQQETCMDLSTAPPCFVMTDESTELLSKKQKLEIQLLQKEIDAADARDEGEKSRMEAEVRIEAEKAKAEAEKGKAEAEKVKAKAEKAKAGAEKARAEAFKAMAVVEKERAEIELLCLRKEKAKILAELLEQKLWGFFLCGTL